MRHRLWHDERAKARSAWACLLSIVQLERSMKTAGAMPTTRRTTSWAWWRRFAPSSAATARMSCSPAFRAGRWPAATSACETIDRRAVERLPRLPALGWRRLERATLPGAIERAARFQGKSVFQTDNSQDKSQPVMDDENKGYLGSIGPRFSLHRHVSRRPPVDAAVARVVFATGWRSARNETHPPSSSPPCCCAVGRDCTPNTASSANTPRWRPNPMPFRSPRCSMRRSRTPASRSGRTRRFISRVRRWTNTAPSSPTGSPVGVPRI